MSPEEGRRFLEGRFGIRLPGHVRLVRRGKKLWAFSGEDLEVGGFKAGTGIPALRETKFGPKPTTYFALAFGHLAERNVVEVGDVDSFVRGEPIPSEGEDGYVIVRTSSYVVGVGLRRNGVVRPLVPKEVRQGILL